MYPEKKNPFQRVGFHEENEPAQRKNIQPLSAPILTPGQRYAGSYLSPASIGMQTNPEKSADSSFLRKNPLIPDFLPNESSAQQRLGERNVSAAVHKPDIPLAQPSLWRAPSFAGKEPEEMLKQENSPVEEVYPGFAPNIAQEEDEENDQYLPPMDSSEVYDRTFGDQDDDYGNEAKNVWLTPMKSPSAEKEETSGEHNASVGARPMRGFGMPVFFPDIADEDPPAEEQSSAQVSKAPPAETPSRRRSRRNRRNAQETAKEADEKETLISAAPHAYTPVSAQIPEEQMPDAYKESVEFWKHNFDMDSVPAPAVSPYEKTRQEDIWGVTQYGMLPGQAYPAMPEENPADVMSYYPQEESFYPGGMVIGQEYSTAYMNPEETYNPPYGMEQYPQDEFAMGDMPMDGFMPGGAPIPGYNAGVNQDNIFSGGEIPHQDSVYPPENPAAQEALYRQYVQMSQQVQAPLENAGEQPRPVPVYVPPQGKEDSPHSTARNPIQGNPPGEQKKPVNTRQLLGTLAIIAVGAILLFLLIAAGTAVKSFLDNQNQMQLHQQEYKDSHGYYPQDAAILVDMPPAGQTIQPTVKPTTAVKASADSSSVQQNIHPEESASASQSTPKPARSKLERYPDNPLRNMLESMASLNAEYPDVKGKLVIQGLLEEYVVHSPNNSYLSRNYRGTASPGGSVYMADGIDLRLPPENLLLRASDSVKGTGFNALWQFRDGGASFCQNFESATMTTLYEEEQYVLFAVVNADTDPSKPGYFSFADKLRFESDEAMLHFVNDAKSRSLYSFPVDVIPSDRLLTLATVSSSANGQCMVLVYRMLRDGETIL